MGKSAKFKKFKKLASALPTCNTVGESCEIVSGSKLIERGVTEVNGVSVIESREYKQIKKVPVPMDHHKNMKRNYYRGGMNGVAGYANAVVQHVQNLKQKQP